MKSKFKDRAIENDLTEENIWLHLLTFSKTKWLDSKYFHSHLVQDIDFSTPEGKVALEDTQRRLAIIINNLIRNLMMMKDQRRIVTSARGYKIGLQPEEFEESIAYQYKKIKDPLTKISWWKEGLNELVHTGSDKSTEDMFYE